MKGVLRLNSGWLRMEGFSGLSQATARWEHQCCDATKGEEEKRWECAPCLKYGVDARLGEDALDDTARRDVRAKGLRGGMLTGGLSLLQLSAFNDSRPSRHSFSVLVPTTRFRSSISNRRYIGMAVGATGPGAFLFSEDKIGWMPISSPRPRYAWGASAVAHMNSHTGLREGRWVGYIAITTQVRSGTRACAVRGGHSRALPFSQKLVKCSMSISLCWMQGSGCHAPGQ